ncbi:MAG: hypothetical protein N2554_11600 [Fimbriimonadales bacterium]|nr:hypothetical protein [Fimbriimonadales bacterium]
MLLDEERFEELLRLLDSHPEWLEALQERIVDEKAILRVLEKRAEVRDIVRRQILQDDFLRLPALVEQLIEAQQRTEAQLQEHNRLIGELIEAQRRTEAQVQELVEVQRRHEAQLQELVEVQRRHEAQLQEVIAVQHQMLETQQQMLEEIRDLSRARQRFDDWLRGEEGRRRGEQFERETIRRAWRIFRDGEGGSPDEYTVRRRVHQWLAALRPEDVDDSNESDPSLADLIWWKDAKVVVAEISVKVDYADVRRAHLRAQTLRRAGVDAIGAVLGEEWSNPTVRELAQELSVEWFIRGDVSEGMRAFQRIQVAPPEQV